MHDPACSDSSGLSPLVYLCFLCFCGRVLYDYGFPMGPFAMSDLAGLDISWKIRKVGHTDFVNCV